MKRSPAATTTKDLRLIAQRALDARLRDSASTSGSATPTDERTTNRLLARVLAAIDKHLVPRAAAEDANAIDEAEVIAFVDRMRLDELRLVVRCEAGDEAAWRELIAEFTPTVRAAARQACGGAAGVEADDLAASVWADLYGGGGAPSNDDAGDREHVHAAPERKGKLAYYSGCGSLGGWLRAVVAQLAVDHHRRTRRLVQLEDETSDDAANPSASAAMRAASVRMSPPTPEQSAIEAQADDLLARSLRRAVAELPAADGLLLRLYYIDGLRLREAGVALGCSEATASRRLNALHKSIRERTSATLAAEAGMNEDQIAELFAAAAARPGADVRRWLAPASNDA